MLAIMVVIIITMMIDVSLARVYNLIPKSQLSSWKIFAFSGLAAIVVTCQYFVLGYISRKNTDRQPFPARYIRTIGNIVKMSQIVVSAFLIFLTAQVVIVPYYYTPVLVAIVSLSYGLAAFMMALLTHRFLSWAVSNKNRLMILYAVASASLAVNVGFTLAYANDILLDRPIETKQFSAGSMVTIMPNTITASLNSGFYISTIVSFSFLWGATVTLLHHRAKKLGQIRYWLIISSPLALFLSQFISIYINFLDPLFGSDPVSIAFWKTLVFTISKPAGGILFGLAFLIIARSFKEDIPLRRHLIISACGFALLFAANQASVLLVAPFPPFGILSVALVGLASSLIFSGIYSVAVFLSEDAKLRQLIRRASWDESGLLGTVGMAQMKEQIQKRVAKIMKDNSENMKEATGVESMPSEKDVVEYIDEVMKEMMSHRAKSSSNKSEPDSGQ